MQSSYLSYICLAPIARFRCGAQLGVVGVGRVAAMDTVFSATQVGKMADFLPGDHHHPCQGREPVGDIMFLFALEKRVATG